MKWRFQASMAARLFFLFALVVVLTFMFVGYYQHLHHCMDNKLVILRSCLCQRSFLIMHTWSNESIARLTGGLH